MAAPVRERAGKQDVLEAPPIPPTTGNGPLEDDNIKDEASNVQQGSDVKGEQAIEEAVNGEQEKSSKKKRKHEGETAEERAERKRKKKEKKAKRASQAEAGGDGSD